jgi:hypothetical protein
VTSALHDSIKNQSKSSRMHDFTPNIHPHPYFTATTIPIHPVYAMSYTQHTHCPHATNVPCEFQVEGNGLTKSNGATSTHISQPPPTYHLLDLLLNMTGLKRTAGFAALRFWRRPPTFAQLLLDPAHTSHLLKSATLINVLTPVSPAVQTNQGFFFFCFCFFPVVFAPK